jgi:hypothetical protein
MTQRVDELLIFSSWYHEKYLTIDQGTEVVMIEKYRTGLLWGLLMSVREVQNGLNLKGFTSN